MSRYQTVFTSNSNAVNRYQSQKLFLQVAAEKLVKTLFYMFVFLLFKGMFVFYFFSLVCLFIV